MICLLDLYQFVADEALQNVVEILYAWNRWSKSGYGVMMIQGAIALKMLFPLLMKKKKGTTTLGVFVLWFSSYNELFLKKMLILVHGVTKCKNNTLCLMSLILRWGGV